LVSYEEWLDWKQHPVTKAFYSTVLDRIHESKEFLSLSAGLDHASDNMMRGFIRAYNEMLEFKVEKEDQE